MESIHRIIGVDVLSLAACHIESNDATKNTLESVQAVQSAHRLRLLEAWSHGDAAKQVNGNSKGRTDWSILKGRIIEIGCGQGDQTAAIAALMEQTPELHNSVVYGIDPAPPGYGAPFTLEEAQSHLLKSPAAKHIQFQCYPSAKQALEAHPTQFFHSIIFSHSLWYFSTESQVLEAFLAARQHGIEYLLIAEWDLSSRDGGTSPRPSSLPHLLAVLLQTHKSLSYNNVRLPLSPPAIKKLASIAGWDVVSETTLTPGPLLQDGRWEVGTALSAAKEYLQKRQKNTGGSSHEVEDDAEQSAIESHLYALQQSLPSDRKTITSLDVWTCKFVPKSD